MTLDFGLLNMGNKKNQILIDDNVTFLENNQVETIAGLPAAGVKEGTLVVNTAQARLYVSVQGSLGNANALNFNLNELSGTDVDDISGNGHDGTATSAAWTTDGKFDGAFDCTTAEISVPAHADFNWDTIDFTIEMWVKPNTLGGNQTLIERNLTSNPTQRARILWFSGSKFYFEVIDASSGVNSVISSSTLPAGSWTHIAVVGNRTGNSLKLYINGNLEDSDNLDITHDLDSAMLIGSRVDGSANFPGTIDEVKIWKTTRSASQIKDDSLKKGGLVWSFVDLEPT
jgi:hypothetical protein